MTVTSFQQTRVLVMHGENLVDAGLAVTLSRHPDVEVLKPCTADTPDAVLHWLFEQRVDILITDYDRAMPLAVALEKAAESFHRACPHVVVVTNRTTQAEVRHALKLGVAGYLTHTSPADEVVDAVRNVRLGIRHVSGPLARSLLDDLLDEQLTPRETEVLRLAAQGFANKVIASRLLVEVGTVKCHMRAILEKLRAGNRTEAVVIAHQRGLLAFAQEPGPARAHASSQSQLRRAVNTSLAMTC